jgi:hypothetical protein
MRDGLLSAVRIAAETLHTTFFKDQGASALRAGPSQKNSTHSLRRIFSLSVASRTDFRMVGWHLLLYGTAPLCPHLLNVPFDRLGHCVRTGENLPVLMPDRHMTTDPFQLPDDILRFDA